MRRASNNQSERWNISRFFTPSTALEEDLELEEEVPIEEEVEEDGKLEEEEQEERGRSASSTWNYLVYLQACGVGMGLAYLLCAVAGQGNYVTLGLAIYDTCLLSFGIVYLFMHNYYSSPMQLNKHKCSLCIYI